MIKNCNFFYKNIPPNFSSGHVECSFNELAEKKSAKGRKLAHNPEKVRFLKSFFWIRAICPKLGKRQKDFSDTSHFFFEKPASLKNSKGGKIAAYCILKGPLSIYFKILRENGNFLNLEKEKIDESFRFKNYAFIFLKGIFNKVGRCRIIRW